MRFIELSLLFATIGCNASKDTKPTAPADAEEDVTEEDATADAEPEDVVEEKPDATVASCEASETVIYTQTQGPIRAPADNPRTTTLTIYDNGHWTFTDRTGCLSADELASLTTQLESADIAAPPLEPGMARCMAMPMTKISIEAGGKTATWEQPCGPSNPTDSVEKLMEATSVMIVNRLSAQDADPVADPNRTPLGNK